VSSCFISGEIVSEGRHGRDGALRDLRDAVHVGAGALQDAVPVDARALLSHLVLHVHDDPVAQANLQCKATPNNNFILGYSASLVRN